MADPDLEKLEAILRAGVRDLHDAAEKLHPHVCDKKTLFGPKDVHDEAFERTVNTFNNGLLKGHWQIAVPAEIERRDAFLVAVACVLDHYAYISDSSINPDPQKTVMVPAILMEELQRAAQGFAPKIKCVRHPDRTLEDPRAPEAAEWMTQKVYDRTRGAFVMHRYCPECAQKHARGELI